MQRPKKVTNIHDDQFNYLGRWVDKSTFRAFVYDAKGEQKLASSHPEFESLIASGIWFAAKPDPSLKVEKKKDATLSNSK